jgi:hypothetical protein
MSEGAPSKPVTVHCPLGGCHSAVRLAAGTGVYYLQAYDEDPSTPIGYPEPDPRATVGGSRFVDERHRRELTVECTDGHALRLHLAEDSFVDRSECLYGPVETSAVRCPDCQYRFGEWSEFVLRTHGPTVRVHELVAVTAQSPPGFEDLSTLARAALIEHDRIAHRRNCPNCGTLVAFAYELQ